MHNFLQRALAAPLLLLLALAAMQPACAQSYTFTDLGTLPGYQASFGAAINDSGQVTGYSEDINNVDHAFVYSNGILTDLGTLPSNLQEESSTGSAINASGQVAGSSTASNNYQHAFLYSSGHMTDLGTLIGGSYSYGRGINASGQVTGYSNSGNGNHYAFVFSHGAMLNLGTLPGGTYSSGFAINDSGQVTGDADSSSNTNNHPFLYSNGMMIDIGLPPGAVDGQGLSINASGQITGEAEMSDMHGHYYRHTFLYSNHAMTDLGLLPGYNESEGDSINDAGQIVGSAYNFGRSNARAVLYRNGQITDLNTLIPASSGWTLVAATGINNNGFITGQGLNPQGQYHAFLLTPVASTTPARFDFNGDGHNDLLWHNTSTGQALVWDMNDQTVLAAGSPFATVSPQWTIAAVADVNADGHPDILWENTQTGQLLFWLMGGMNGTTVQTYGAPFATVTDTHWRVASMADFNGDGKPDILWENSQTGQLLVWDMNGATPITYGQPFATVANTAWTVAGSADFNNDGHPDLLWRNANTGQLLVWSMGGTNGTTVQTYGTPFATLADPNWHIVGTGDTNGDTHPDIVWQNSSTGQVLRWLMGGTAGTTVTQYGGPFATVTDTHWQIVGVH